jgi:hypothetical protein
MAVYTVHEPPPPRYESNSDPERYVFVRDGFSFWAFLLGPLWMLWHRMWWVLLGYILVVAGLEGLVYLLDLSEPVSVVIGGFLALLIGFEAATLRRFTLARRRWRNVGIIVGDDLEIAERRFFDALGRRPQAAGEPPRGPEPSVPWTASRALASGLLPEAGTPP